MAEPQDAKAIFDGILAKLGAEFEGVTIGKLFGMPCGKVHGKAFAGFFRGDMVFKLYGTSHARALGLAGARLFDPAESERPMREWVQVPAAYTDLWLDLAADALEYVLSSLK